MMVLVMTVVFVVAFMIIDIGLWLTERRGAQKDADASALAGAQAYVANVSDTAGAFNQARDWAIKNGVDPAKIDGSSTLNCSAGNSCIAVGTSNCGEAGNDSMPWVEANIRHDSLPLFSSIFTAFVPDIGATARACVGSPRGATHLSPFGVQTGYSGGAPPVGNSETGAQCGNGLDDDNDGTVDDGCTLSDCLEPDPANPGRTRPVYGRVCVLKTGAQGGAGGQRGQLTLGNVDCKQKSNNTERHDFHYGTLSECLVNDTVYTGSGNIQGLLSGLQDRLAEEGRCDQLFGPGSRSGYDEFKEVFSLVGGTPGQPIVPSATNKFSENACSITSGIGGVAPDTFDGDQHTYTPRAVDLVLIDQFGQQTAVITGFAAFYVIGCWDDTVAAATKAAIELDLSNTAPFLNRCNPVGSKSDILGIFVQSLAPSLAIGDPDPRLPTAIVLQK